MTTAERIVKLKADRQAELKAAEEERGRLAAAARAEADRRLEDGIAAVLLAAGAEWLAEFRADGVPARFSSEWRRRFVDAVFEVPGHRRVTLGLAEFESGWLPLSAAAADEYPTWFGHDAGGHPVGCETLADALIASEATS